MWHRTLESGLGIRESSRGRVCRMGTAGGFALRAGIECAAAGMSPRQTPGLAGRVAAFSSTGDCPCDLFSVRSPALPELLRALRRSGARVHARRQDETRSLGRGRRARPWSCVWIWRVREHLARAHARASAELLLAILGVRHARSLGPMRVGELLLAPGTRRLVAPFGRRCAWLAVLEAML